MHITIIIPTFNQSRKLSLCLQHLSELNFDQTLFEVLVIDNGSTDDTKDIALSYKDRIMYLNYHYCAERGLMAGRHMGAEKAKGDILCYLDDDSMVSTDWLTAIEESFQDENVVIAGGPCIPKYEVEPPDWVEYFWHKTEYGRCHDYLSLIDFGKDKIMINPIYVFGCNYAIRKRTFYEYGGARPDFYPEKYRYYRGGGETSLSLRILNAGHKAFYHPKARIDHLIPANRLTLEYFYWKRHNIGIGASYQSTRQKHGFDGYIKPSFSLADKFILKIRRSLGRIRRGFISNLRRLLIRTIGERSGNYFTVSEEPSEILSMREQLNKSFQEGYAFHQRMLKEDPKLMEWVLRENYLGANGKLPVQ